MTNEKRALARLEDKLRTKDGDGPKVIQSESPLKKKHLNQTFTISA